MDRDASTDDPARSREARPDHTDDDTDTDTDLGAQVRSTVARLYRRFRSERADGELGDATLDVLAWLDKRGPQTLTELSTFGQVAPASMSQSVNRLTDAGYATRTPDPRDRRKVLFRATPEGAEIVRAARARRNAWLRDGLDRLSVDDRSVVARACELFREIADG